MPKPNQTVRLVQHPFNAQLENHQALYVRPLRSTEHEMLKRIYSGLRPMKGKTVNNCTFSIVEINNSGQQGWAHDLNLPANNFIVADAAIEALK